MIPKKNLIITFLARERGGGCQNMTLFDIRQEGPKKKAKIPYDVMFEQPLKEYIN